MHQILGWYVHIYVHFMPPLFYTFLPSFSILLLHPSLFLLIKFAVTIWECYTFGEDPWVGLNGSQILKKIDREGERLHHPDACPPDVYQLMLQCWDKTPTERPTFAAIK